MPAVLVLKDPDRVRVLAAVARRGPSYQIARVVVITISQLLLLAVPLLGIVRVDLWAGHHVLLGEPATLFEGLRGMVIAIAVLWGFTFATNIIVGRFFCGWGCPVGYVSRLGEDVELARRNRLQLLVSHGLGAAFVAVFVGAIMLWWVDWRVMQEAPRPEHREESAGDQLRRVKSLADKTGHTINVYLHIFISINCYLVL